MNPFSFYKTTIGKKFVVAITGAFMVFFVAGHMVGNLKAFGGLGADGIHKLDHYAEFLRTFAQDMMGREGFLWSFRIALLLAVLLHVVTVIKLSRINRRARSKKYKVKKSVAASLASKTMMLGGVSLLAFIVFHILHLTTGDLHSSFVHGRVYANVYDAFQNPAILAVYIVAMIFLGMHLYHGVWSVFQTLGINTPEHNPKIKLLAKVFALVVAIGFMAMPLAIYFGYLSEPVAASILH